MQLVGDSFEWLCFFDGFIVAERKVPGWFVPEKWLARMDMVHVSRKMKEYQNMEEFSFDEELMRMLIKVGTSPGKETKSFAAALCAHELTPKGFDPTISTPNSLYPLILNNEEKYCSVLIVKNKDVSYNDFSSEDSVLILKI
ncbi:hypothetical protein CEXT_464361 [Caerostris extrusa]|uniref:Uncharacterized protein n=1 Tax=Caerostris extrusa TaxID=172846 RepID=A0AAV4SNJ4_CAEEX|nr:hypothetical protein CEXT_464361 [Caerostris extrusa]